MPIHTQFSSATLPPWMEADYRRSAERSQAISQEPYHPFPGQRVAPMADQQRWAQNLAGEIRHYRPNLDRAENLLQQGTQDFPDHIARYMNPYQQQVVDQIAQLGGRTFNEQIMPRLESEFVARGTHGSGRHQDMAQRSARDMQENITRQQAQALHSGYESAGKRFEEGQLRKLAGSQQSGELGRLAQAGNLADIGALSSVGELQRGITQQGLDVAHENFQRQNNYPQQQLGMHLSNMAGVPQQSQGFQSQYQPGAPQYNTAGNLTMLAGNLYGAGRAYGRKKGGVIKAPAKAKTVPKIGKLQVKPKGLGHMSIPKVARNHALPKGLADLGKRK